MENIFTYLFYFSLLFFVIILTSYKQNFNYSTFKNNLKIQHFFAIFLISFVVGFRYEVGNDWFGYVTDFELVSYEFSSFFSQSYELGFYFIMKLAQYLGGYYQIMFFISAFISWYFIFKSVPKFLLPLSLFFIFADEYFFWSMNGVRQFISMSIWLFAIRFIVSRNFLKYLFFIVFGSLFHYSILLLIPIYFLPFQKLNNKFIWMSLFIFSYFIGSSNIDLSSINYSGINLKFIDAYFNYIESGKVTVNEETSVGLGFYFKLVTNFLLIILSSKVLRSFPKFTTHFVLFFIGAILFNISYDIQLFGRFNNYFLVIKSIVLALSIIHFWNSSYNRIIIIIIILLYLSFFWIFIFNSSNSCCPYQFSF
jgi:transmembrane protein EpsG